jgi:cation transport protein ChaC
MTKHPTPAGDNIPEATLEGAGPAQPMLLTREVLLSDRLGAAVRAALGDQVLSDEAREASLAETLRVRPDDGPVWLFGYGSLIWNPTIHYVESRFARVEGWQRSFCLCTPIGRGTPENPGLVLALDEGGLCDGIAFRLEDAVLEEELSLIWRREMITGAYIPHWVPLRDAEGSVYGQGIAFTVNRAASQYADLPEAEVVRRLATATGALGSAADYLFQTREGLQRLGIHDALVEDLALKVTEAG